MKRTIKDFSAPTAWGLCGASVRRVAMTLLTFVMAFTVQTAWADYGWYDGSMSIGGINTDPTAWSTDPDNPTDLGNVTDMTITSIAFSIWSDANDRGGANMFFRIWDGGVSQVGSDQDLWLGASTRIGGDHNFSISWTGTEDLASAVGLNLEAGKTYYIEMWAKTYGDTGDEWYSGGGANYHAKLTYGTSILTATVTGVESSYDWTGSVIHPVPTVTLGDNVLSSSTDYDVTYSEGCTNVGDYTVTITGKGNYAGSIERNFSIVVPTGYYLVGDMNGWNLESTYQLAENTVTSGEYYINNVELSSGQRFKVVCTDDGKTKNVYYPNGMDDDYVISAAGTYDIYFRPNYDCGDDWYNNCIFVANVTPVDPEDTYIVAGNNTDIFGSAWDGTNEDNTMVKGDDGKYRKEYTVDEAYDNVQLKVVRNGEDWIGDANGDNFEFNLTGAGTFTVVFDPDEEVVSVTGTIVEVITQLDIYTVYAVGNGEGVWLNGAAWDPGYAENEMTEVADNVWQIKYKNVPEGFERDVKFIINGTWDHNFGWPQNPEGDFVAGEWFAAVYNGANITFYTDDICTVTLTLDLSSFDFDTKLGAQFKIDIDYGETPVTEEVEVTLAPTGYGTYYNSGKMVTLPTDVVAYAVSDVTGDQPTYVEIADGDSETNNTVPASTAMLLYCDTKPEKITLTLTDSENSYSGTNLLHGSDVQTTTTGGGEGAKYYKLTYGSVSGHESIFGWYWGADNGGVFTSPAHKAWLVLPANANNNARAFFNLPDDDATGIASVVNKQQNADNVWYDLNGRRINAPKTKGIYVKDGRKLVIK